MVPRRMVGRIVRLPDDVANQIAAGEVVERPASVVKELVENALDADARRVRVEVEGGGHDRITVTDDGHGMTEEDARLCLERHATSKITCAADLTTVRTLGFRGEAIPSIASVSRFTLVTRARGAAEGTELFVAGGKLERAHAAGAAEGTSIDVRDLFYNVPARKKFLKRPATEMSHITDALVRLALAHRDRAFTLIHNGRTVLDIPPEAPSDPVGRLRRILGKSVGAHLYPIPDDGMEWAIGVTGFVSSPEYTERTARGVYAFVNGRFVRDRTIQHAIQDAYRTLMERGRHPVVVLFITLDPERLDVNVHPQKTEVRFERTSDVHKAVSGTLRRALTAQPWLRRGAAGADAPGEGGGGGIGGDRRIGGGGDPGFGGGGIGGDRGGGGGGGTSGGGVGGERGFRGGGIGGDRGIGGGGIGGGRGARDAYGDDDAPGRGAGEGGGRALGGGSLAFDGPGRGAASANEHAARLMRAFGAANEERLRPEVRAPSLERDLYGTRPDAVHFGALEPVGQVLSTYLVCQGPDRMVIIDQHAAHERIAFETMRRQHAEAAVAVQPLLVPLSLELDPARAAIAEAASERLAELGVQLEPFGGSTWVVKSYPVALGAAKLERLVLDLLDELKDVDQTTPFEERLQALLSCAACHTVVRAGDRLTRPEITALLEQMDRIDFGAHCPHGRPVFVEYSAATLAKMFHRT